MLAVTVGVFDLRHSKVVRLEDTPETWPSGIVLDGAVYDSLHPALLARERLPWLGRDPAGFVPPALRAAGRYLPASGPGRRCQSRLGRKASQYATYVLSPLARLWSLLQDAENRPHLDDITATTSVELGLLRWRCWRWSGSSMSRCRPRRARKVGSAARSRWWWRRRTRRHRHTRCGQLARSLWLGQEQCARRHRGTQFVFRVRRAERRAVVPPHRKCRRHGRGGCGEARICGGEARGAGDSGKDGGLEPRAEIHRVPEFRPALRASRADLCLGNDLFDLGAQSDHPRTGWFPH